MKLTKKSAAKIAQLNMDILPLEESTSEHIEVNWNPSDRYTDVSVVNNDCIDECLKHLDRGKKVGLLNFGSGKKPGGGYLNGKSAQEEDICRRTTLYQSIKGVKGFYDRSKDTVKGYYSDSIIYSKNVSIIRDNRYQLINKRSIDVVTCAAPNLNNTGITFKDVKRGLTNRINNILYAFESNGIDVVILGAFGCGVFKNDPMYVASIFSNSLEDFHLKEVVFAILNDNTDGKNSTYNYECFKSVFE